MYLLGEKSTHSDQLAARIQKIGEHLLDGAPKPVESISLNEINDLFHQFPSDSFYIISSGTLYARYHDKPVAVYEKGDLIGLNQSQGVPGARLNSDEPLILDRYDATELLRFMTSDTKRMSMFTSYLITLNALYSDGYGYSTKIDNQPNVGYLSVDTGETIISAGSEADHVYIITEGKAEVFVEGTKVGDVLQDEIFGAMAVFTGTKRSASVIASEPSTVLAVPKNEFKSLMTMRPETTLTLIENMARAITSLNNRIADQDSKDNIL